MELLIKAGIFLCIGVAFVLWDARKSKGTRYIGGGDLQLCPRCKYEKPESDFRLPFKIPSMIASLTYWDRNQDRKKEFCSRCIYFVNAAFCFVMLFGLLVIIGGLAIVYNEIIVRFLM